MQPEVAGTTSRSPIVIAIDQVLHRLINAVVIGGADEVNGSRAVTTPPVMRLRPRHGRPPRCSSGALSAAAVGELFGYACGRGPGVHSVGSRRLKCWRMLAASRGRHIARVQNPKARRPRTCPSR